MKFMLFVLPTVPGTLEDRKRLRPIGRNNERYQQMLDELRKPAVFAAAGGFDQGFMPWDEEMRQIELFAKHIIPAFR
jgi:hypothetical protein